jgi:hypothetical protein
MTLVVVEVMSEYNQGSEQLKLSYKGADICKNGCAIASLKLGRREPTET